MINYFLISIRPHQWIKNILVFAALVFSLSFLNLDLTLRCTLAFISFCLISSSIYLINDLRDRKEDQLHPSKKFRPIAAGKLSPTSVIIAFIFMALLGILLAFLVNINFLILILVYVILNLGYSMGLKKIVLLDIMIVAMGFLLRAFGGAIAIDVVASPWLFICTLLLALLLVIGKRRNELLVLESDAVSHRKTLAQYTVPFLDGLMFVSAGASIITYSLYSISEETVSRFGTNWLIGTTPIVIYGVFRFLYLIYVRKEGEDPTKMIVKDLPLWVTGLLWGIFVFIIIYFSNIR